MELEVRKRVAEDDWTGKGGKATDTNRWAQTEERHSQMEGEMILTPKKERDSVKREVKLYLVEKVHLAQALERQPVWWSEGVQSQLPLSLAV